MASKGLLSHSFVRFLLVGAMNTVIGLGTTYLLLHAASLSYWPATFIGNTAGAVFSYFMNRSYTFRSAQSFRSTFPRFALVVFACYALSFYSGLQLSHWLAELLPGYPEALVKDAAVLIGTVLYTVANYAGQRLAVFREPGRGPAQARQHTGNGE